MADSQIRTTTVGDTRAAVPGADREALAIGRIHTGRVRGTPLVPSWVLKVIMAITGTIFALFVLVHMFGNLKVFTGAEHFNDYAHWLRTILEPLLPWEGVLWILRVVLSTSLVAHVWAAVVLWLRARASRGPHRRKGWAMSSFAARSMPVTGVVLLGFIVFHLMDLTIGTSGAAPSTYRAATMTQSYAYNNLVASFDRPLASGFYMLALIVLFLHLVHGLQAVVIDLGGTGKRLRAVGVAIGGVLALAVMVGNILIPVAVLSGVVS